MVISTVNISPYPAIVPISVTQMDDQQLETCLKQSLSARTTVVIVCAEYVWKLYAESDASRRLVSVDADSRSKKVLKKLATHGLLKIQQVALADLSGADVADASWQGQSVDGDQIAAFVTDRLEFLGRVGRGANISPGVAQQVWADAGCRCMFKGCGQDLGRIPLYNKTARVGYLAHIVASDPRGPRGNVTESHALSNDPDNIMLMCDAHHRLIDCFAPEEYDAQRLREMREQHIVRVRRYLDALALPIAQAVTLFADLGNVATYFRDAEFMEAILADGAAMLPDVSHHIRHTQRDDRGTANFWANYLREHELDIQRLVAEYGGGNTTHSNELAIFPLHHTATLILAGRIIGEARPTKVFQYDRHRKTWQWDSNVSPAPAGTFRVVRPQMATTADEALITIELTASVPESVLPSHLTDGLSTGILPRVSITTTAHGNGSIKHRDDLDQFIRAAREAVAYVTDTIRAKRVHVVAIAPASAVFCFGQLLQAGHQPPYLLYDRADANSTFIETFAIEGQQILPPAGSQQPSIRIR